jgi:hypothetical protein
MIFHIEDDENGHGLCKMIFNKNTYYSYRFNWICFAEPTKII